MTTAFLKHNGQHDQVRGDCRYARALDSKTGIFDVIRETPAFFFIETNDGYYDLAGELRFVTMQVSKKTLKLAGRYAPYGGQFSIVEF